MSFLIGARGAKKRWSESLTMKPKGSSKKFYVTIRDLWTL